MAKIATAWVAVLATLFFAQQSSAFITWANGTVQTIEEIWLEGPNRPCCYDIPKDTMVTVDPAFAVYTEPGCKVGTRTCKWPAPIASIWVCNCTGTPSNTSLVTPKPAACCGNVAMKTSPPVGASWRNDTLAKCNTSDDTQVFLGRGIPIRIDCYYDPLEYKGITGLTMYYGPKRTLAWTRGGTWGKNVTTMTKLGGPNGEKITQFRAKWSTIGVIEYLEFNTTERNVMKCGNPNLSAGKPRTYYAPDAKGTPDPKAKRTGEYLGTFVSKECTWKNQKVLSALTPVWARDATYWPYPGMIGNKAYIDEGRELKWKVRPYVPAPWLKRTG